MVFEYSNCLWMKPILMWRTCAPALSHFVHSDMINLFAPLSLCLCHSASVSVAIVACTIALSPLKSPLLSWGSWGHIVVVSYGMRLFPFNSFSMVASVSAFGFDLILVHVFVVALLACIVRYGISLSPIVGIFWLLVVCVIIIIWYIGKKVRDTCKRIVNSSENRSNCEFLISCLCLTLSLGICIVESFSQLYMHMKERCYSTKGEVVKSYWI